VLNLARCLSENASERCERCLRLDFNNCEKLSASTFRSGTARSRIFRNLIGGLIDAHRHFEPIEDDVIMGPWYPNTQNLTHMQSPTYASARNAKSNSLAYQQSPRWAADMDLSGPMSLSESTTAILSELHPEFKDMGDLRDAVQKALLKEDGRKQDQRISEAMEAESQTDDALILFEFDKLTPSFPGPFVPEGLDLAVTYDQEVSRTGRESPQKLCPETHQNTFFGLVRSFRPKLELTSV